VVVTVGASFRRARAAFERLYVEELLRKHHGNITHAAEQLGMQRPNLYRKMREFGLRSGDGD